MADNKKNNNQPEKKGIGRRFKEMGSELKKVTWPTFPTALKNTGIVLLVVAIFLIVLLIFDTILRFGVFNFLSWESPEATIQLLQNIPILSNIIPYIRPIFNL